MEVKNKGLRWGVNPLLYWISVIYGITRYDISDFGEKFG
jgi:hypothetical protein